MTTDTQRQTLLGLLNEACSSGARMRKACQQTDVSLRTVQRWLSPCHSVAALPQAEPPTPGELSSAAPLALEDIAAVATPAAAQAQEMASPVLPSPVSSLLLTTGGNETCQDRRQSGLRQAVVPHNKRTEQEVKNLLDTINSDEFKDLPPSQIVPRLADRGCYLASESTIGRIMRCHSQNSLSPVRAQSPKTP